MAYKTYVRTLRGKSQYAVKGRGFGSATPGLHDISGRPRYHPPLPVSILLELQSHVPLTSSSLAMGISSKLFLLMSAGTYLHDIRV